jgi:hypothetical protein
MNGVRLYWWFKGTDPARIGGPWWCKDFKTREEALAHMGEMGGEKILHKALLAPIPAGDYGRYKVEYDTGIKPPDSAEVLI